jgi:hypothetical protein
MKGKRNVFFCSGPEFLHVPEPDSVIRLQNRGNDKSGHFQVKKFLIRILSSRVPESGSGSRRSKITHKRRKKLRKFHV